MSLRSLAVLLFSVLISLPIFSQDACRVNKSNVLFTRDLKAQALRLLAAGQWLAEDYDGLVNDFATDTSMATFSTGSFSSAFAVVMVSEGQEFFLQVPMFFSGVALLSVTSGVVSTSTPYIAPESDIKANDEIALGSLNLALTTASTVRCLAVPLSQWLLIGEAEASQLLVELIKTRFETSKDASVTLRDYVELGVQKAILPSSVLTNFDEANMKANAQSSPEDSVSKLYSGVSDAQIIDALEAAILTHKELEASYSKSKIRGVFKSLESELVEQRNKNLIARLEAVLKAYQLAQL